MKKRWITILILTLVSAGIPLAAGDVTITSTYYPEPYLSFQYGPPTEVASLSTSQSKIYSTNLTALLGYMILETDGNQLFDPSLISLNVSPSLYIEGYVRDEETGQITYAQIPADLRAISGVSNDTDHAIMDSFISSVIVYPPDIHLATNSGNAIPSAHAMVTFFVLVAQEDVNFDIYIPGVIYTLTDDSTVGSFAVSAEGQSTEETTVIPVSVDGATETEDAPFIPDTGTGTGEEVEIPFGGGGYTFDHYFDFSVLDNNADFDLSQAVQGLRPTIASVQLQVLNALPDQEYGVEIAFTSKNPAGFTLNLDGDVNKYGIPYHLYFGTDTTEIPHAQFIDWANLFTGSETFASTSRDITVSIDSGTVVDQALEGNYSDTVTVNIIPLDIL